MKNTQISMIVTAMLAGTSGMAYAQTTGSVNFVNRGNPNAASVNCINGTNVNCINTTSGTNVAVSSAKVTQGTGAIAGAGGIAIGDRANANGKDTTGGNGGATAIGVGAQALSNSAMAFGTVAVATGNTAIAMGRQSAASGDFSMAMGNVADAEGGRSIAMGHSAQAMGSQSIAIGSAVGGGNDGVSGGASFDATTNTQAVGDRTVAIGAGARTNGNDQVALGSNAVGADNIVAATPVFGQTAPVGGAVSFGSATVQRQLKNVAAGADGTDAVNVNQLSNVNTTLNTSINTTNQTVSNLSTTIGGQITNLQASDALSVKYTDSTHNTISLDGKNGGTTITNVATGVAATDAANVGQLSSLSTTVNQSITNATKDAVQYDSAAHSSVTLGGADATSPVGLHNVAAGTADTDAVNVGQIKPLQSSLSTATGNITNLQSSVANISSSLSTATTNITNLQQADTRNVKYDGASGFDTVTLKGSNGTTISNVTDGVADHDAVNVGQLKSGLTDVTNNVNQTISTSVSNLSTSVTNQIGAATKNAVQYDSDDHTSVTLGGANAGAPVGLHNVADGAANNDAVNFGQLSGVQSGLQASISTTNTNVSNLSTSVSNIGAQVTTNTTNITALQQADTRNVKYDGADGFDSVTLAGTNGTQVKNVADGTDTHDAVNVSQLTKATGDLSTSISNVDQRVTNVSNTLSTSISNLDGRVTTNETNISGLQKDALQWSGTLGAYDASHGSGAPQKITNVAAGDVSASSTDAINGAQLKSVQDQINSNVGQATKNAVQYDMNADGSRANSVTLAGGDTTKPVTISNVADGVSAQDAVNVGQLGKATDGLQSQINTTNNNVATISDQVNTNTTNISNNTTAISGLQQNALQFDPNTGAYNASRDGVATKIVNVADGSVAPGSKDAVNGGQLSGVQSNLEQQITNVSNATGEKLKNAVMYSDDTHAGIVLDGKGGTTITNVGAGTLTVDSTDAVNGSQLYATNQTVASQGDQITKNTTDISNIDQRVTTNASDIANLQASDALSVKYDSSAKSSVTFGGSGAAPVTLKNVAAGVDSTDAVNVGQLDKAIGGVSETANKGWNVSTNGGAASNVAPGATVDFSGDSNVQVSQQGTNVKFALSKNLNADSLTTQAVDGSYSTISAQGIATQTADGRTAVVSGSDVYVYDANGNRTDLTQDGLIVNSNSANRVTVTASGLDNGGNSIKNVATGVADTDVVNVKQLNDKVTSAVSDGTKNAVQYDTNTDGSRANSITLIGGQSGGVVINNVAPGAVTANSMQAVNGSQLYGVQQQVNGIQTQVTQNTTDINNLQQNVTNIQNGKAGVVQQQDPNGQITVGAGTGGTSVNFSGTSGDRTLTGVANGVNANDAVNKGQLDTAISNVSGNVTNIQNQTNSNTTWINRADAGSIGTTATATGKNSVAVGAGSVADRDNSFSVGATGAERQVTNVAAGTAPTDAVNVQQLNDNVAEASAASRGYTDQRVGQVYNDLNTVKRDMFGGVASAMAVAGLPQPTAPGRSMVSAAASNYHGQQGFAAGYSYVTENEKWVVKASVTGNTRSDFGAVVGAGYQF